MNERPAWRVYLDTYVRNMSRAEKQRLFTTVGVTRTTVLRWRTGENTPDAEHLQRLLQALPDEQRRRLYTLLQQDPRMQAVLPELHLSSIPSGFYAEVFRSQREASDFWTLCEKILHYALEQLTARCQEEGGIEVMVVRCMPPRAGRIQSLRVVVGMGTPPWRGDMHPKEVFLGAESLVGYSVMKRRGVMVPNLHERHAFLPPVQQIEHEESVAAYPIVLPGKIAGALVVFSSQSDYFSPDLLSLIEQYADLIRVAFDPAWFYPASLLELRCLPSWQEQKALFAMLQPSIAAVYGQTLSEAQGTLEERIQALLEEALLEEAGLAEQCSGEAPTLEDAV